MKNVFSVGLGLSLLIAGCGTSEPNTETAELGSGGGPSPSAFMATSEPEGAIPVGQARENVEDGQEVTLVGIVGGSTHPFVDGIAAFTIVDPSVPYCSPDEGCPTPWDYCCTQDQVKGNVATIKVVDETGAPIATDARTLLGAAELSTVVVKGTAERDEQGNLSLAAKQVFVRGK